MSEDVAKSSRGRTQMKKGAFISNRIVHIIQMNKSNELDPNPSILARTVDWNMFNKFSHLNVCESALRLARGNLVD